MNKEVSQQTIILSGQQNKNNTFQESSKFHNKRQRSSKPDPVG